MPVDWQSIARIQCKSNANGPPKVGSSYCRNVAISPTSPVNWTPPTFQKSSTQNPTATDVGSLFKDFNK